MYARLKTPKYLKQGQSDEQLCHFTLKIQKIVLQSVKAKSSNYLPACLKLGEYDLQLYF